MDNIQTEMKVKRTHKRRKKTVLKVVSFIIAAAFAVVFLFPTVVTIANSFMSQSEISANYGKVFATSNDGAKQYISGKVNVKLIPDMVSFNQYFTVLLKSPAYLLKFWNSVILVVPITLFQILIAALASYGFARTAGKIKGIIFFSYIILMLMPYQVTLVPNYLVADWFHLINTNWAIWLPGIFSPFSVYLLTKYMKRIPTAYFEAAQIDGAGEWQMFLKIAMPVCKSALFSCAILVFIDYWNMVEQPLILFTDEAKYPLSIFLSKINEGEIGLAFAVATIYMIPGILIFLYSEEYLVEGIAYQGGVKG